MNPRLKRALQRGGVTAMLRPDCWGVWRSKDRRGRMIGTVSGADIDLLRLRNCLQPLGETRPVTLIWTGPIEAAPATALTGKDVVMLPPENRSMLDLLLRDRVTPEQRAPIRQACQAYLADLEVIGSAGTHVTMNWDRLATSDRPKQSAPSTPILSSHRQHPARNRLRALAIALSHADLDFLEALVLRESSRSALSRRFSLRLAFVEQRGLSVLRALVDVYQRTTKLAT